MKKLIGALGLTISAIQSAMAQPVDPVTPSHCTSQEDVIFDCPIGKKHVSVCNNGGDLQYRFGRLGSTELAFPQSPEENASVTQGTIMLSGGGGDYLRFSNGDYDYVVYSAEGRGVLNEGVVVEKDGKRLTTLKCSSYATNNISSHLPDGIEADTTEFAIP